MAERSRIFEDVAGFGSMFGLEAERLAKKYPDEERADGNPAELYDIKELDEFTKKLTEAEMYIETVTPAENPKIEIDTDFIEAPVYLAPSKATAHMVHTIATEDVKPEELALLVMAIGCQDNIETAQEVRDDFLGKTNGHAVAELAKALYKEYNEGKAAFGVEQAAGVMFDARLESAVYSRADDYGLAKEFAEARVHLAKAGGMNDHELFKSIILGVPGYDPDESYTLENDRLPAAINCMTALDSPELSEAEREDFRDYLWENCYDSKADVAKIQTLGDGVEPFIRFAKVYSCDCHMMLLRPENIHSIATAWDLQEAAERATEFVTLDVMLETFENDFARAYGQLSKQDGNRDDVDVLSAEFNRRHDHDAKFRDIINELEKRRRDPVSSDREAAAAVLAYEKMEARQKVPEPEKPVKKWKPKEEKEPEKGITYDD